MKIQYDEKTTKEIEEAAKEVLKDMGIKMYLAGFNYWVKAVTILIEEDLESKGKVKIMQIYEMVADECYTTTPRAERAMRHAVKTAKVDAKKYFNVEYKVHNSAFMFLLKEATIKKLRINEHTI